MQTLRELSRRDFQHKATVLELLQAGEPFIVRGFSLSPELFEQTLALFKRTRHYLFNILGNQAEGYSLKSYQEILEAIARLREYAAHGRNSKALIRE